MPHHDVMASLLILLIISVIAVVGLQRLRLPAILGYLLVGAIAGPYGLALIGNLSDIHLIAEYGVVFLLFMLGLEFSLPRLIAMRRAVIGMGGAQVLATAAVTGLTAWFMGFSPAAAFVLAGVMTVSSTAIVIKQLGDQLEINSRHGNNAVGVLLFQDLAAIPFLIIIPVLGATIGRSVDTAAVSLNIGLTIGAGVLAAVVLFFGGRWVLRPLFREIARSRSAELFTLAVLLVVLGAGWLTNQAGISYELGAFLAGIALSETQYKHQIESDVRPFRDVLLGLFFITIGMMLNVRELPQVIGWVLLLLALLILVKTVIVFLIGRSMGEEPGVALRTGLVLAQGGEFGFAMLAITAPQIMTDFERQMVLAVVIFSMALTPIIVKFNGRITKAIVPSYQKKRRENQAQIDQFAQDMQGHVVICGFGRVGQNVARLLQSEGFEYTAIEIDPDIVQQALQAGLPVHYGNSTHTDILRAAGLGRARALVVSHLDQTATIKTVEAARSLSETIPIMVRARSDEELDPLFHAGANEVVVSIYEMSLVLSGNVLRALNVPVSKILRQIQEIRREHYAPLRHTYTSSRDRSNEDFLPLAPRTLRNITLVKGAYAIGRTLESCLPASRTIVVDAINRGGIRGETPQGDTELLEGDILTLYGAPDELDTAEHFLLSGRE
ncbi:cation:proton antiporter [Halothiobacillus sp. DCM-1]|uniref:cation:proton antiporter domain-containing protein n=1 Tax=Halothiobacillus sp. DCM-1 TaxID=3112558 RepID=UPI0032558668